MKDTTPTSPNEVKSTRMQDSRRADPDDELVGTTLDGRWTVIRRIGKGAMGVVYLAEQANLHRQVALKLLHEEYSTSDEYVRRFEREARALSRLQHVHCTSILDVGEHENRPYIVMELVHGHRLTVEIGTPVMTPVRAAGLVRQMLMGLCHAHGHNIVHRDLKPDNLMITELAGVGDVIKILDFGFAHISDSRHSQSNAELVPGTPSYMSPEQAKGLRPDARTDLYSTGIILYELCVGHKPFIAREPLEVLQMHIKETPLAPRAAAPDRNISESLEQVILHALAKSRDDRFPSAELFQVALEGTPEGRAAMRSTGVARDDGSVRKARRYLIAAGALAIAGIGVAAFIASHRPRPAAISGEQMVPIPLAVPPAAAAPAPAPTPPAPPPRPDEPEAETAEPTPQVATPQPSRQRTRHRSRRQAIDPEQPRTRR
jgi:eukaryotic-like serine/threonine-protein kinase